jgi:tRNA-modifying protein YgfZ
MAAMESLVKTKDNSLENDCSFLPLDTLGVLRVRGADVVPFLQGQLSNDVTLLTAARSLLAGYHNPQGRVIAVLRLLQVAPGDVIAVLPRELIASVAQRLAKFILRAKVKLTDESPAWSITGIHAREPTGPTPTTPGEASRTLLGALPTQLEGVAPLAAAIAVRVAQQPARWLLVSPAGHVPALAGCTPAAADAWLRLAIRAGEPQVHAATSEEFVAQMLNLDAVGAIAFDKGCYTGQEVIARAHYRGRVKRRLQRFRTRDSRQLTAGDGGELSDGRAFKVVSAVALADGGYEFLAVAPLVADASEGSRGRPAAAVHLLVAEQLPLAYPLPE